MKIEFIKQQLSDGKLRKELQKVVSSVEALIPSSEDEFMQVQKFGLYPAELCNPFVTKQGTPYYELDNMSVLSLKEPEKWMLYGDFRFRQIEVLFNMARMDSVEAHEWLRNSLFQQRMDARKKTEYKSKFRGCERADWKEVQVEWMKYCLMVKYRDNDDFCSVLHATPMLPVEDATSTSYASNLFWGAKLVEIEGRKYYFGCNVLGKLLAELRTKCRLDYKLPQDFHLFGKPILDLRDAKLVDLCKVGNKFEYHSDWREPSEDILYSDGYYAIAGLNSSVDANDPNVISADDMSEFAPSRQWLDKYKHFICIDILRGGLYRSGLWKRLFSKYEVGRDVRLFSYYSIPSFSSTVVCVQNYIAVVRCTYPEKYAWLFKEAGYNSEQVASVLPGFTDNASNSFYVLIRPTTQSFIDLNGNPSFPPNVYEKLFACKLQIASERASISPDR